ncbi:MAG: three-Cys-motif partner protein TcmP [Desulfarculaceae bacterium]|nr:three-Cys-motif partner protein TcmP [Desulfarculaceae bacterium]
MVDNSFFEEPKEQSKVKSIIVAKYFKAWSSVMLGMIKKNPGIGRGNLAYVDLYAGPGVYKDGTISTPILILEQAVCAPELMKRLKTFFNDINSENINDLEREVAKIPNIKLLQNEPRFMSDEVGEELIKIFENNKLPPTLSFLDPWGYKGLTLPLIKSLIKDFGSDCIFFFNYARINRSLEVGSFKQHLDDLFGERRAEYLRSRIGCMGPDDREDAILSAMTEALRIECGGKFVLNFRFKDDPGIRTSHHLFFVSKHYKGYDIMKTIMSGESSKEYQGVPSFEYAPVDNEKFPLLAYGYRPMQDLRDMLLEDFSGESLSVFDIYMKHNFGKPYIIKHYKDALKRLEAEGRLKINPPAEKRRKNTLADNAIVTFPEKGS